MRRRFSRYSRPMSYGPMSYGPMSYGPPPYDPYYMDDYHGPCFWDGWYGFDPRWAHYMEWMDSDVYVIWRDWQVGMADLRLGAGAQRESLIRQLLQTQRSESRTQIEALADKIMNMTQNLGADQFGHVSGVQSTTTTTTSQVTPQQRQDVAQRFLQSKNSNGGGGGGGISIDQASNMVQEIYRGERDEFVLQQVQREHGKSAQPAQIAGASQQLALPAASTPAAQGFQQPGQMDAQSQYFAMPAMSTSAALQTHQGSATPPAFPQHAASSPMFQQAQIGLQPVQQLAGQSQEQAYGQQGVMVTTSTTTTTSSSQHGYGSPLSTPGAYQYQPAMQSLGPSQQYAQPQQFLPQSNPLQQIDFAEERRSSSGVKSKRRSRKRETRALPPPMEDEPEPGPSGYPPAPSTMQQTTYPGVDPSQYMLTLPAGLQLPKEKKSKKEKKKDKWTW